MALTITIPDLGEIRADTAAELAALVKQLRKDAADGQKALPAQAQTAHPTARPAVGQPREFPPQVTRRDRAVLSLRFLQAIDKADVRGVPSVDMQQVLGVDPKRPKGISGKTGPINLYLQEIGLNVEDVYTTSRTTFGRVWYSGKRIAEAISKIESELGASDKNSLPLSGQAQEGLL